MFLPSYVLLLDFNFIGIITECRFGLPVQWTGLCGQGCRFETSQIQNVISMMCISVI